MNVSGTLLEGISLWGELAAAADARGGGRAGPALLRPRRQPRPAASSAAMSIPAIRRLVTVEALLEVRKKVTPYIDLQLVAFPQDGYYRRRKRRGVARTARSTWASISSAASRISSGRWTTDAASVTALCKIAADRGLPVDMHCDETDDPMSRHIETLAAQTVRFGLQGRVAGSHLTSMHSMDNYYVSKLIPLMAEAEDQRHPQSADQHHAAGPARHLSEAARHDPGARADGCRPQRLLRPRLRHGPPGIRWARATCWKSATWRSMSRRWPGSRTRRRSSMRITVNSAKTMGLEGYGLGEEAAMPTSSSCRLRDPLEALRLKRDAARRHPPRQGHRPLHATHRRAVPRWPARAADR